MDPDPTLETPKGVSPFPCCAIGKQPPILDPLTQNPKLSSPYKLTITLGSQISLITKIQISKPAENFKRRKPPRNPK